MKVAYMKIDNAGDLFNENLLDFFNVKYARSDIFDADVVMLGGLLSSLLPSEKLYVKLGQKVLCAVHNSSKPLHVWGSGFLRGSRGGNLMRTRLEVHALRGQMSKEKLEGLTGRKYQVTLCDPGLLASRFVDPVPEKKYAVGIIPHFREQDEPVFKELAGKYGDSLVIDIKKPCEEVLREIAECECILSSSLHGLIFADSLGVPNKHIVATEKLLGDGFKFKDYYSSFRLDDKAVYLSHDTVIDLKEVKRDYAISMNEVEDKIGRMIEVFPKTL